MIYVINNNISSFHLTPYSPRYWKSRKITHETNWLTSRVGEKMAAGRLIDWTSSYLPASLSAHLTDWWLPVSLLHWPSWVAQGTSECETGVANYSTVKSGSTKLSALNNVSLASYLPTKGCCWISCSFIILHLYKKPPSQIKKAIHHFQLYRLYI